ncbi:MAG: hypothetical protein HYU53_03760 [Acidobacteria bacterium]|nr:hypothetical protein [Acidobacteriota bacterium]
MVVLLLAASDAAGQTTVSVTLNTRFLSGSFGSAETTSLFYAPAGIRLETGRFEAATYFPYLTIRDGTVAPSAGGFVPMQGTVVGSPDLGMSMGAQMGGQTGGMMGGWSAPSLGSPPASGTSPLLTTASGFGDVIGSVGYRVLDDPAAGLQVVVAGRVKIPTASASRGLGTGKVDVGGTGTLRKQFASGWVYGEGGYLRVGDPAGVDLRNAVLWSFGTGYFVTKRVALLGSASGNSAILPGFSAPAEIGGGVGVRLGSTTLSILPTFGLSEASPSYAVNISLGTQLFRR